MPEQYTISQLARAAVIPTTTLRYYERIGLLEPEDRSHGNYRLYGDASLHRLRFIRAAQATGFTLQDIEELLRAAPCGEVQELIEARLAQVRKRAAELRHLDRVLRRALDICREHEASGRCGVIDTLSAQAGSKPTS